MVLLQSLPAGREGSEAFFAALDERCDWIRDYLLDPRFQGRFHPPEMGWAATAYVRYGGKRLRPAILLFSCGAVGGDERLALPAAAAVEIFHTWTLVHDDIIDRDAIRRGEATVHEFFARERAVGRAALSEPDARHYGVSLAILTGDIQHGWGVSLMAELTRLSGLPADLTLDLIDELDTRVLNTLVEGEVLDIQFALQPVETLSPEMIEDMLWRKTGALYEFCGMAGAMIGLRRRSAPEIEAVGRFAALCGTAFQLQDDILGVTGNQRTLGKPVGSDLREGKKTLVIHHAFQRATPAQRERLSQILGNGSAGEDDVREAVRLLRDLGAVESVSQRARSLIESAMEHLERLPDTSYRDLLRRWADYMIAREF